MATLPASFRHEKKNSSAERTKGWRTVPNLATTQRGGTRSGSGRPRMTLLELVRSASFRAENWRHRALLESEELPIDDPTIPNLLELRRLQDGYRLKKRCGVGASALWIARSFSAHLREEA
jgi:predicted nucleic acid-binding protein